MATPSFAESLARGSTEALLSLTLSGRVLAWSHGAELVFGYTRDESLGRLLVTLLSPAEDVERVQGAIREAASAGVAVTDGLRRRKDGSLLSSRVPVRMVREGEGPAAQLTLYVGRDAALADGDRFVAAPPPTPLPLGAPPLEDPLREPLEQVRAALHADAAAVYVLGPRGDLVARALVVTPGGVAPAPLAHALRGAAPVAQDGNEAYKSLLGVSVRVGDAPVGVLQVASRAARLFSQEDARVLTLAADMLGWTLRPDGGPRASLSPATSEDLSALRAACERAMESSHEPSVMLAALSRVLVPRLADWCAIDLVEPGGALRRVASAHRERAREPHLQAAAASSAPLSTHDAVRSARLIARLAGDPDLPRAPEEARALESVGGASWLVVPIAGRVRVLGAISVGQVAPERAFREPEVAWLRDLARRAALEIENLRLHDLVQRSRDQATRSGARAKLLQDVAASLSEALTPLEITESVVARAREGLRASGGALATLADDRIGFEIAGTVGAADALYNAFRRFPVHARVPLADAGRSKEIVAVESIPAGVARYPHLASPTHERLGSLVAVPLVVDGRTVGALGFVFEERRAFDADDLSFLRALARQCGDAVERSRLLNAERSARASADNEARRAAFLADASRILAASFDYTTTLAQMGRMLVPVFADWCMVHLLEADERISSVASVHADTTKAGLVDEIRWAYKLTAEGETGIARVMRTGRPEIHFEVPDALLDRMAIDARHAELMRKVGVVSQMIVPMTARGRVLGAITFRQSGLRRFGVNDVPLAEELALRAAIAVDNARLFHEAQDAIRRREESLALLTTLLASAPIGIAFFDAQMRVARINEAMVAAGAPTRAEGLPLDEALPFLPADTRARFRSVLAGDEPVVDLEVEEQSHGRARHWLASCYPVEARAGERMGVGLLLMDITERKRAEQALRESEERARLLIDGVKDHAIIGLDAEGRIASWNEAARRIHGYDATDVLGQHFRLLHPHEEAVGVAEQELDTALDTGRCEVEGWRVRKDGSRFYASVLMAPLRDDTGRLVGFSKLTRDMTETRRAREDLERARQQVVRAEKLSTMGTLVSGVAHEIRTPLTAIANSLYMVKMRLDKAKSPEELKTESLRGHMDMALESIDRINRLVQDLRRFTKVPLVGIRERAGLESVAGEALSLFRAAYRGRIEVVQTLAPTPPCEVDRAQIQQLVLNLLQNASEAMPHGGVVRLVTGVQGDHAYLKVVDTGTGMPPEVAKRMFEEFFTTKAEGTGLGLSIVRRIVEAHNGRIECDTALGTGTTFTVSFPVVKPLSA